MEQYTQAPYYLTLKSNGCLIVFSALSPTELVVASKHSLGTRTEQVDPASYNEIGKAASSDSTSQAPAQNVAPAEGEKQDRAHAEVGREWLKKTLQKSGRLEAELAGRLWDENLTAVLEVCPSRLHRLRRSTVLTSSSATMNSKNTSSPLPPTGPVCICTVSITIRPTSLLSPRTP